MTARRDARANGAEPVLAVAVPSPLRTLFDYLPPSDGSWPAPGARVRVPFGRRRVVGVVVERRERARVASSRLRRIIECLDEVPLLDESLLALLRFASDYFHHPPGEVVTTMLPPRLRRPATRRSGTRIWELTGRGRDALGGAVPLGARQRESLAALDAAGGMLASGAEGLDAAALRRLEARAMVRAQSAPRHAAGFSASARPPHEPVADLPSARHARLNAAQQHAASQIGDALGGFAAFLLDGVTGSGKTEVYVASIERVLARGEQALVLIPEIGLTPQLVERFRARLGVPIAALHSGMAEGERLDAWLAARDARADVVVGTRSAVFAPLARPGLLIVDEEHDLSYKQQDGLRYSARDLAVLRARQAGVPIVLGSASPSLESLHNVALGRYREINLPARAGGAAAPRIEVVDLRARALDGGLSEPAHEALAACLDAGEQAILFVNRRGYAPVMLCHACGAPVDCPRCDAHMVLHRDEQQLRCHHCGRVQTVPERCACGAEASMRNVGFGTERLVEHLRARFDGARIERVDRDSTRRRGSMEALLRRVHAAEIDVLVGTQMLAKGHDFPRVTLVVIVDADGGLFSADFRAGERMAQLLTQVGGRAGRGARPGRVLIQTHHPQHALLRTLIVSGYRAFGDAALAERRAARLPPFAHLALLRAEAPSRAPVHAFLGAARAAGEGSGVDLLGPVPSPMERRAGRVRAQLLIESIERARLHAFLRDWLPRVEALAPARKVRWSLDVDPQEML